MAFCSHCGQTVPDNASHCPACGAETGRPASKDMTPADDIIDQLLRDGRTIEAIKTYREATGASLSEAKDAIESWGETDIDPAHSLQSDLSPRVRKLAGEGRKIEAIKAYRSETGTSLRQAKEDVESWMRTEGIASSAKGCATMILAVTTIGIGLIMFA